jgi:O-antigen ligase
MWPNLARRTLEVVFGLTPLFLVTVQSWANAVLILGSALSIIFLLGRQLEARDDSADFDFIQKLVVITLVLPFIAIAVSSTLRASHAWADYDAPSRFLLAIAIFLFAIRQKTNIAAYLQYAAPASLVITLLHQLYFHQPRLWGPDRMSTYFSDPLVFGYTSLTLGLVSLVSINAIRKDSKPLVIFKLLGAAIGFYLSVKSGSRTGWLAAPIVIALWLYQLEPVKARRMHLWAPGLALALVFGLLLFSTTVNQRVTLAFDEVASYSWSGLAPETSVGMRITFLRIAFDMFASQPLAGFGDTRGILPVLPSHIANYASPESLRMAVVSGFHNEIVTNAIRSGVLGLVSAAMLFGVPLFVFGRQMRNAIAAQRDNALIGLVFTLCIFISSLSTEVFDLKYTASFYAVMISLLCASAMSARE